MSYQRVLQGTAAVACILVLAAWCADHPSRSVPDARQPTTFRDLRRLTQAWRAGEVKTVIVIYVPRSTHTLSNVRPEGLDSDFRYLLIMKDAKSRSFCRR